VKRKRFYIAFACEPETYFFHHDDYGHPLKVVATTVRGLRKLVNEFYAPGDCYLPPRSFRIVSVEEVE